MIDVARRFVPGALLVLGALTSPPPTHWSSLDLAYDRFGRTLNHAGRSYMGLR